MRGVSHHLAAIAAGNRRCDFDRSVEVGMKVLQAKAQDWIW